MKLRAALLLLHLPIAPFAAQAGTSCDDLEAAIAAKLHAKGVKNYTLDALASDEVGDQKVVGTCDGGAKKLVCTRGAAS